VSGSRLTAWHVGARVTLALACALPGARAAAQSPLSSPEFEFSADTVALGDAFHLRVAFDVPPGTLVYFPDTLTSTPAVESLAPVAWAAQPSGAGARLTLTYALIAFRAGDVPVPGLDVWATRAGAPAGAEPLPGGSAIGAWGDAPRAPTADAAPLRFVRRGVHVTPAITPEQLRAGVEPMPAADVSGSSWHAPAVGLALLSSLLLVGVALSSARARRAPSPHAEPTPEATLEDARLAALAELDRLLGGPRDPASVRALYARSSSVVRTYVERFDPGWGPDLTSSELMARLGATTTHGPAMALLAGMHEAEVVKFGRLRPDARSAEEHLVALRRWVEASDTSLSKVGP